MSTLFYILYCNPARMLKILLCKYTISNTGFMPKWNIRHAGNVMSTSMTFWWVHLQKVASIIWPGIIWEETREITSVRFKFLSHHHNSRANNQGLPMQYITTSTDFVLVTTWWLTAIYLTISIISIIRWLLVLPHMTRTYTDHVCLLLNHYPVSNST